MYTCRLLITTNIRIYKDEFSLPNNDDDIILLHTFLSSQRTTSLILKSIRNIIDNLYIYIDVLKIKKDFFFNERTPLKINLYVFIVIYLITKI